MKKAIVIGAGIGGIASAIRLAVKGYDVQVFETNAYPGGKLTQIKSKGFRFDAGPSLLTMPELIDELFELAGKKVNFHFQHEQLENICKYFYEDGTILNASSDLNTFAEEAEKQTGVKVEDVLKHLKKSKFIYKSTAHLFLNRSLHKTASYLRFQTFLSLLKLPFLGIYTTMNRANNKALHNPKMEQLFNRYATYNGSNPYKAPGILNIIPHLEFNKGAYFPTGGMHSITSSLHKLAQSLGVRFEFNSPVDKIVVKNKKATGIIVQGDVYNSDLVVCNMDVVPAFQYLLSDQAQPTKILQQERSSSALIFYWGINATFEQLELHNILFAKDYASEFEMLANNKEIHHDPTIYINITCKKAPNDAPIGKENWFVMINVPHNNGQDWDRLIDQARKAIIAKVNNTLNIDLETLIETENILDPRAIEANTQSYQGALYGTSSNTKMAAFFRHPNFAKNIKGLYFCGGSVHPGGGIPLALSSAKIVDNLIPSAKQ